jgi:hypothetical protein
MTKVSELYTLYLKPAHLPQDGSRREATIEKAEVATLHPRPGQESKAILISFVGKAHKLILNQSNANRMYNIGGDDTDAWAGLVIGLRRDRYGQKETIVIEPGPNGAGKNGNGKK